MRHVAALVVACAAVTSLPPDPAVAQGVTSPYLQIVWRYRAGDELGAVRAMLAEPTSGLRERARHDVGPLLCRTVGIEAWPLCSILAVEDHVRLRLARLWHAILPPATLLHIEVAVMAARLGDLGRRDVHRQIALDLIARQWAVATLRDGTLIPELGRWAGDGARLFVWALQLERDVMTVRNVLADELGPWRATPDFLLAAGWVEELLARPIGLRGQYQRVPRQMGATGRRSWMAQERQLRLAAAESLYRRAVSAGDDAEARVRLGRVLVLRAEGGATRREGAAGDRLDEAAVLLRAVRADAEPRYAYLASLFLAATLEQRGSHAAACQEYQRALGDWPDSQAARVALSRLFVLDGQDDWARALTTELGRLAGPLGPQPEGRLSAAEDPWFWYDYGQAWRFRRLLAEGKARFRE